jgi:hypothetical protein
VSAGDSESRWARLRSLRALVTLVALAVVGCSLALIGRRKPSIPGVHRPALASAYRNTRLGVSYLDDGG